MLQAYQALPYCSGGGQDTWGCAEEAGHRGPSLWGLHLAALPRIRTKSRPYMEPWPCGLSNAKRCWRESPIIAPKVHFLNTVLSRECPLRMSVRRRPIRFLSTPRTGWSASTSREALSFALEMRKTTGDATSRPDIAAQAAGDSLWPLYRSHGQIRAASTPLAIGGRSRQARSLLFAPKVHFLNTVLSRECPLRLSVRDRSIRFPSAPCTG